MGYHMVPCFVYQQTSPGELSCKPTPTSQVQFLFSCLEPCLGVAYVAPQ